MLKQVQYMEPQEDRISSRHRFRNRSASNAGTFGYIDSD
jgi:hypothetical protein